MNRSISSRAFPTMAALALIAFTSGPECHADQGGSYRKSFNDGWRFHSVEADGADAASYDDSDWRTLDLPHDWAIEGPFDVKFNARCGGLPFHGTGWYRKTFHVPADVKDKHVSIVFDGAMYNAHVWINGHFLGNRPYGYIEFQFDVTKYLSDDGRNVIAVKLAPEDLSTRWYPGAGIYRNVWIDYRNPVHVAQWGTFVTTPRVSDDESTISVETALDGELASKNLQVKYEVLNSGGDVVAKSLEDAKRLITTELVVSNPKRWDLESPYLYTLSTTVLDGRNVLDVVHTRFGIRTLEFTKKKGFFLNGKQQRIQGVCLHHDNGPLGAVVNRRAIERKLQIMKRMGANSVRTSHNPPSNELLDLCDELGILVQVESFDVWRKPKVPNGYKSSSTSGPSVTLKTWFGAIAIILRSSCGASGMKSLNKAVPRRGTRSQRCSTTTSSRLIRRALRPVDLTGSPALTNREWQARSILRG